MIQRPRRAIAAAVLSLSEGGFGLETPERVEQGDSIRLLIHARGAVPEVEIEAIVWYDHPAPRAFRNAELRLLGCVVPDRSPAFLDLFAELEQRNAPRERPTLATRMSQTGKPRSEAVDVDLPRSRAPLAPPKPEPEASLPSFRVRFKQIGGPRTRSVSVRACSFAQAAERALSALSGPGLGGADAWELLEIAPGGGNSDERKA